MAVIPEDLVPPDCPWPIVLGIDPGTRVMGYGALVVAGEGPRLLVCGVLQPARGPVAHRLGELQEQVEELVRRLRPSTVAIETAFAARNVASALRIGEARGMVLATAGRHRLPVREIAPAAAKKAVLGHGGGTKEQVAAMVCTQLGAKLDVPLDATDALAVALAYVAQMRLEALRAGSRARR